MSVVKLVQVQDPIDTEPTFLECPNAEGVAALFDELNLQAGAFDRQVLKWVTMWIPELWVPVLSWTSRATSSVNHVDLPDGPVDAEPEVSWMAPDTVVRLLRDAGVKLGKYDVETADWIARKWRAGYLVTILSWINRAHASRLLAAA